jgi:hypothetical protein
MKKVLLILLPAFLLLSACKEPASHEGSGAAVQLNDGERWQANPETTDGIAKMQSILENYESGIESAERQAMRDELEATFQEILIKCTMEGEAHEQLHNYLLPMQGLFEKIGGTDDEENQAAAEQLKNHLAEYSTYFK